MTVTNRRIIDNSGSDFYPTPAWATEALIDNETFDGIIYEPACGDGAMSEILKKTGNPVVSSDLNDHGYEDLIGTYNFLDTPAGLKYNNIITNPPYNVADEFVEKALTIATKKVAFLLRLAYMEGQARYNSIYSQNPPARVYVFSERITFYKKNAEKKGSGTTAYAWFVWDKEQTDKKTELLWLPPIYKNAKS